MNPTSNLTSTPDSQRKLDAQRDSLDFRDLLYRPALVQLKEALLPNRDYLHVMDQGQDGACTGFGLAAVINYLLRTRNEPASTRVSPRMLYEMAKHHDRWPGEDYEDYHAGANPPIPPFTKGGLRGDFIPHGSLHGWFSHLLKDQ